MPSYVSNAYDFNKKFPGYLKKIFFSYSIKGFKLNYNGANIQNLYKLLTYMCSKIKLIINSKNKLIIPKQIIILLPTSIKRLRSKYQYGAIYKTFLNILINTIFDQGDFISKNLGTTIVVRAICCVKSKHVWSEQLY